MFYEEGNTFIRPQGYTHICLQANSNERPQPPSLSVFASLSGGDSHDGALLPIPESMVPQTKVPIHGGDRISSLKVQAMKQAKDRIKQLARLGPTSNLDFSPHSLDKLDPEFVSEEEITEMHARLEN